MTILVHVLILRDSKLVKIRNPMPLAILTAKAKKARKSASINLVMLALSGPLDAMVRSVHVIGGIKLIDNNLIVLGLVKFHQLLKPHSLQITDKLLNLQLWSLMMTISVNVFHVKDRRLSLLAMEKPVMDQVIIEIEVKGVPKPILNPQILAFFRIKIAGTLFSEPLHIVTIVN